MMLTKKASEQYKLVVINQKYEKLKNRVTFKIKNKLPEFKEIA